MAPVRIHPDNPKLFEFRGRPLVLLTATEHYGAVLNRPFRFERYLRDAAANGMTLTRLFTLFRELQTPINPASTCKPASPDYLAPYARTGPGFALDGEPRFDLDRDDPSSTSACIGSSAWRTIWAWWSKWCCSATRTATRCGA